jgi:hypothetical protein
MFRKLASDSFADLFVSLAGQPVRGGEAVEVRHGLQVPDDDVTVHGCGVLHNGLGIEKAAVVIARPIIKAANIKAE